MFCVRGVVDHRVMCRSGPSSFHYPFCAPLWLCNGCPWKNSAGARGADWPWVRRAQLRKQLPVPWLSPVVYRVGTMNCVFLYNTT